MPPTEDEKEEREIRREIREELREERESRPQPKENFFARNAGAIISVIFMCVINISSYVYVQGRMAEQLNHVREKVADMDTNGPAFGKAIKFEVISHSKEIAELKSDGKQTTKDVSDIKAQLSVVVANQVNQEKKIDEVIKLIKDKP